MSAASSLPDSFGSAAMPGALRGSIEAYRDAWAAWHKAAVQAHFAAVMGTSEECLAPTVFTGDRHLKAAGRKELLNLIRGSDASDSQVVAMIAHMNDYVETCLRRAYRHINEKLDKYFRENSTVLGDLGCDEGLNHIPIARPRDAFHKLTQSEADKVRAQGQLMRDLDSVETENKRLTRLAMPGMSSVRRKVISRYENQQSYLQQRARELAFCDRAISSAAEQTTDLKMGWTRSAHEVYDSPLYSKLQKSRGHCEKDKEHIELVLQSYFDHHSHGASKSESARPDKKALSLAHNLETADAGFKQVQIVDMYCMSRGNELWAIIPDLVRIGHDIDPIACLHWKPPGRDEHVRGEHLTRYYDEQNAAFAQKLLALCSPGLRSTLIGQHEHGVNKVMFTASPDDGCAMYWVMIQMYHPLSRDHRRKLGMKIAAYATRFYTGDPKPHFKELRLLTREALDIVAKLPYDQCVTPLLDALSTRDPLYTVDLKEYRTLPTDPDNSAFILDKLIGRAITITEQLDVARKRWDEKSARLAQADDSEGEEFTEVPTTQVEDDEPDDVESLRDQLKDLQAEAALHAKAALNDRGAPKVGFCQAKGCTSKIENFKPGSTWRLCSTCLLKARTQGSGIEFANGTRWPSAKVVKYDYHYQKMGESGPYQSSIAARVSSVKSAAKKAKSAQYFARKAEYLKTAKKARAVKLSARRNGKKQGEGNASIAQSNAHDHIEVGYERMVENLRNQRGDDE